MVASRQQQLRTSEKWVIILSSVKYSPDKSVQFLFSWNLCILCMIYSVN